MKCMLNLAIPITPRRPSEAEKLVTKLQLLMGLQGSFLCSQDLANGTHPQPFGFTLPHEQHFELLFYFNIIL